MTGDMSTHEISRRAALGLGLGVAAGTVLAACSKSGSSTVQLHRGPLPAFEPAKPVPGATISHNPLVPVAVDRFTPHPYRSVARQPAHGGQVTAFQLIFGSSPPTLSGNMWEQQLNKNLGATWSATYIPAVAYTTKIATMLAGGSIPDISWIEPNSNAPTAEAVLQGAFADLTDLLAGDGIKNYPNLAHIPAVVWERSSIEGAIFGVPQLLPFLNDIDLYRADWADKLGYPQPPKNADEVLELFTAFSKGKPAGSVETWGIGSLDSKITTFASNMFRVPNNWKLSAGGKLTYYIETDEYEAAVTYLHRMWRAGVFNPDALLYQTDVVKSRDLFIAGRTGFYKPPVGWMAKPDGGQDYFQQQNPDGRAEFLLTPGHDGGAAVVQGSVGGAGWYGMGAISASAGKSQSRLAELLRVLDYWAAPFGSSEYLFINYGIEGRQFTYDNQGNPVATSNQKFLNERAGNYLVSPWDNVLYFPGTDRASTVQRYWEQQLKHSSADPTLGLVSITNIKKSATLTALNTSYENDIISGRKPVSALKEWRSRWRSEGGDKIRQEYEASLQRTKAKPKH